MLACRIDLGKGMRFVSGKKRVIDPKKSVKRQYASL
jgi:hypothetical protein